MNSGTFSPAARCSAVDSVKRWLHSISFSSPSRSSRLNSTFRNPRSPSDWQKRRPSSDDLGVPVHDVVAAAAVADRVLAQLLLRERRTATLPSLVEVGVHRVVAVGAGHHLGHDHLDAGRLARRSAPRARRRSKQTKPLTGKWRRNLCAWSGFSAHGIADLTRPRAASSSASRTGSVRGTGMPCVDRELVRALLVEHRRAAARRRPRSGRARAPRAPAGCAATSSRPSSEHGSRTPPRRVAQRASRASAPASPSPSPRSTNSSQWRERRTGSTVPPIACTRHTAAAEAARHRHGGVLAAEQDCRRPCRLHEPSSGRCR